MVLIPSAGLSRKAAALCFFVAVICLPQTLCGQAGGYRIADSVAALYPAHSVANLKLLSDKLTLPLATDADKFRSIYRWVCDNIENDYVYHTRNKKKREKLASKPDELREWNREFSRQVFKKLLNERRTVCTGYAWLIKELAYHAGIPCEIVDGYGRNADANIGGPGIPNHSWNAVQLDGKWHLCDATWSSGSIDTQKALFIPRFSEGYFLTTPALFAMNHYPLDTSWLLTDEENTLPQFLNAPLAYRAALEKRLAPVAPATFHTTATKGMPLSFSFSGPTGLDTIVIEIVRGSTVTSHKKPLNATHDGLYAFDHTFTSQGKHTVHLNVQGAYMFTYEVVVGKEG